MKKNAALQYFYKKSKISKINSNIWVKKRKKSVIIMNSKRLTHKNMVKITKNTMGGMKHEKENFVHNLKC